MSAKRLGSVLSNITGTSKQILRVKEDESGFEFVSSPSLPSYTITNDSTDRVLDALDTSSDELANVLSTLIKDMAAIYNGGYNTFQWSTSEQVWPFEKAADGSTLYCKEVSLGQFPNNGDKDVAHGISDVTANKIQSFTVRGFGNSGGNDYSIMLGYQTSDSSNSMMSFIYGSYIKVITAGNQSWVTSSYARIIYAK